MIASVVICTYNRRELLEASVLSVMDQDLAAGEFEIIVVDNNSTDGTRETVQRLAACSPVRITYLFEAVQGLSSARNAGISTAQGEIVVFIDDDIEAEPQWLRELSAVFDSSEIAGAGGPIRPVWPFPRPQWLGKDREGFLTVSEFEEARETGFFHYPHYPWGANIAFRRTIFDTIGLFPPNLGRIGASLLSNEELNLCKRIESAGFKIRFAPQAVIHHKIAPERMRKSWMMRRSYWQGRSDAILDAGNAPFSYSRLRWFARLLFEHHTKTGGTDFDTVCNDRNLTGYLDQLILLTDGAGSSHFRKLRALRTFIASFTNEVEKRWRPAEYGDRSLAQLKQWLSDREQEVRDRDQWLAGRDQSIAQYQQWLADRVSDVRVRDQRLADLDTHLGEFRRRILVCEARMQERDAVIARQAQWLADREQQIHERDRAISEREARLASKKQRLAEREKEVQDLQELQQRLVEKEQAIRELHCSWSWRITSPLRWIMSILLRLK